MGQLLLVRHGQASWDADDYDVLSPTGWEQGRVLGRALAGRGLALGEVSRGSMRRHRETTQACLEQLGDAPEVRVDADWDEFDHVAVLDGMPTPPTEPPADKRAYQALLEEALESWMDPVHADRYAEPFAAFTERVDRALRRTTDEAGRAGSGTVAVFTSGGVIAWVAASLLAEGDRELAVRLWRRLNVVCVNSSLTRLVVGRRGTTLVTFNDHAHLDGHPELLTYR